MADNEYDPDEQPPPPDTRPRLTELLPRAAFTDMTVWTPGGFELAPVDEGDTTWVSVIMPPGWTRRTTQSGAGLLYDGALQPRFLVLPTRLETVTEEEAPSL